MQFSIMFWGDAPLNTENFYHEVIKIAKLADDNGFDALWLPERHFHPWGGMHPNPSVLAAAIATQTRRIKLRAGSVVLPLHDPIRVVEEWSVVDNLSMGRVELAIATGWRADDFVLAPRGYSDRKIQVWRDIKTVQHLWRGGSITRTNGLGVPTEVRTFPRPNQLDIPIWITSGGTLKTACQAGEEGYDLLTHLLGQDANGAGQKIAQYNAYRVKSGIANPGRIALMLHTFVGQDDLAVKKIVRPTMTSYLMNSVDLALPPDIRGDWNKLNEAARNDLIDLAFERYFNTASLMGSVETCARFVKRVSAIGVTEVCCLIDFGLPFELIFAGLTNLVKLRGLFA